MIWNYIKKYLLAICLVVASVFVGSVALMAVYALPTKPMFHHVQKSINLYQREGDYPSWSGKLSGQLDNFTDSIMIRKAIFPGTGNIVNDAMLNPSYSYKGSKQVESMLKELHEETENKTVGNYARYWHGYLLVLKPMFLVGTVANTRALNGMLQLLLASYLFYLVSRQFGTRYGWAYLLAYLSLNPVSLTMSFQFSTMYYIASLLSIYLLKKRQQILTQQNSIYFFTMAGILTAYCDFLTYPLVSYGIPMVIYLLLLNQAGLLQKKTNVLRKILENALAWGIGYGGMYIGKWLISWALTGYNTFAEATKQASYRMSMQTSGAEGVADIHFWSVLVNNLRILIKDPIFIILLIALIATLVSIHKHKKHSPIQQYKNLQLALGIISLTPFVWYIILSNHSYIHFWFTYRELSIFIFPIGCILATKLNAISEHKDNY